MLHEWYYSILIVDSLENNIIWSTDFYPLIPPTNPSLWTSLIIITIRLFLTMIRSIWLSSCQEVDNVKKILMQVIGKAQVIFGLIDWLLFNVQRAIFQLYSGRVIFGRRTQNKIWHTLSRANEKVILFSQFIITFKFVWSHQIFLHILWHI